MFRARKRTPLPLSRSPPPSGKRTLSLGRGGRDLISFCVCRTVHSRGVDLSKGGGTGPDRSQRLSFAL